MKAVTVLVLCALMAVAMAADVETEVDVEKPKKASTKVAVRTLEKGHFMPKHRIVIVPKGDPRARPPTTPASPFAAAAATTPSASPILRAGVTTSAACAAQSGTCKDSSTCSGSIVRGICPGSAAITCCVPRVNTGDCPVYGNTPTQRIAGNGGVMYDVVPIAAQHFNGGGDNTMTKTTACAFARMAAAASASGIRLTINSGFRTLARQQYFWDCYQTKRCNNGNLAARPGTSNHGRGKALDIATGATTTTTYKWMAANAARFGFARTVPSEPWHWEYN